MSDFAWSSPLVYHHVDVFTPAPFTGNSLAVFPDAGHVTATEMRLITREMRHFESVFLERVDEPRTVRARVFDLFDELDFAGHPILGAACILHAMLDEASSAIVAAETWSIVMNAKTVQVRTEHAGANYRGVIDQGRPEFLNAVPEHRSAEVASALGIEAGDLDPALPLEVVSTGLRYLIVPVVRGIERARIVHSDFEALLASLGAEFAYVLDVSDAARPEGRHWNNDGVVEDVATGSAGRTVGAYLLRHDRMEPGRELVLRQGRFVGRPSEIRIRAIGSPDDVRTVLVGGDVALVGRGVLEARPATAS